LFFINFSSCFEVTTQPSSISFGYYKPNKLTGL
jgi:hypothetical protein